MYQQDRIHGKGGGIVIYIKDGIHCKQIDILDSSLKCVGVSITLSPEMYFTVIVIYQLPTAKDVNYLFNALK